MKVKSSSLDYTGGGIWCITGELETGETFIASDDCTIVSIYSPGIKAELLEENERENLTGSPFELTIYDLDFHTLEEYYIKDLSVEESYKIWLQVYRKSNNPFVKQLKEDLREWYKRETR